MTQKSSLPVLGKSFLFDEPEDESVGVKSHKRRPRIDNSDDEDEEHGADRAEVDNYSLSDSRDRDAVEADNDDVDGAAVVTSSQIKAKKPSKKDLEESARETLRMERTLQLDPGTYTVGDASVETFLKAFNAGTSSDSTENLASESPSTPPTSPQVATPTKAKFRELQPPPTADNALASSPLRVVPGSSPAPPRRVASFVRASEHDHSDSDSDDLEIIPATKAAVTVKPLKKLANLAGVNLYGSSKKKSIKPDTRSLQAIIEEKQREQVIKERLEKQEILKAKGIVPKNEDDRIKEDILVESLLEKERKRAEEIRRQEADAEDAADEDYDPEDSADELEKPPAPCDDSEEENCEDLDEKYAYAAAAESSAEESDSDPMGQRSDDDNADMLDDGFLSDNEVQVPSSIQPSHATDEEDAPSTQSRVSRRARKHQIDDDEEDSDGHEFISSPPAMDVGATQLDVGAGTVGDETQPTSSPGMLLETQPVGPAGLPDLVDLFDVTQPAGGMDKLSPGSRVKALQQRGLGESERASQADAGDSISGEPDMAALRAAYLKTHDEFPMPTQLSQLPEPSQIEIDNDLEPSVVEADMAAAVSNGGGHADSDSDGPVRKRRLLRSKHASPLKKQKRNTDNPAYDRKKSKAKGYVEEEAVESDDEWAGFGGASDDEDGDVKDVEGLVDDKSAEPTNAAAIAGLFAEREKERDEELINKILGDVTNGNWRRKRNGAGMLDLSDSEDDEEYARERERREKARIAKMLESQSLGTLASNAKAQAFLASIADPMVVRTISESALAADETSGKPTYESLRASLAFLDEDQKENTNTITAEEPADGNTAEESFDAGTKVVRRSTTIDTLAMKRSMVESARSSGGLFRAPSRRTSYASFMREHEGDTKAVRIETQLTSASFNTASSHKATVVHRESGYLAKPPSRALVASKSLRKASAAILRSKHEAQKLFDKPDSWD